MAPKTNDFGKEELFKDVVEDVANLKSDLRQPDKFAQIFCEAAKSQKNIDSTLKNVLIDILQKDEDAKKSIKSIVESVDRSYWRMFVGKLGFAVWTIIVLIVERMLHHFIK